MLELSEPASRSSTRCACWKRPSSARWKTAWRRTPWSRPRSRSRARLWAIREHIPLAQAADGKNIKHDISVPISRIADFVEETDAPLHAPFPACQVVCFGHLGDGNLHYNVAPPDGTPHEAFLADQDAINRIVHDSVAALRRLHFRRARHRRPEARRAAALQAPVELDLMRAIKAALDPLGIMNPGKIL